MVMHLTVIIICHAGFIESILGFIGLSRNRYALVNNNNLP